MIGWRLIAKELNMTVEDDVSRVNEVDIVWSPFDNRYGWDKNDSTTIAIVIVALMQHDFNSDN